MNKSISLAFAFSLAFLFLSSLAYGATTTSYVPSTPLITDNVTKGGANSGFVELTPGPPSTNFGTTLTEAQYISVNATGGTADPITGDANEDEGFQWNFTQVGGGEITWIFVTARHNATAGENMRISLWNFSSGAYVVVNTTTSQTSLINTSFNISGTDLAWYVDSTNTTMYVLPHGSGPQADTYWLDVIELIITKPTIACTGSNPYNVDVGGSWTVTGETTCNNEDFAVDGNITINAGGNLTLNNTKLRMSNSANTSYIVNKGNLSLANSSNVSTSASNIYIPLLNSSGYFNSTSSFLKNFGINSTYLGINATGTVHVQNTSINNTYIALTLTGISSLTQVTNNTINNTQDDGISLKNVDKINISENVLQRIGDIGIGVVSVSWMNNTNITYNVISSTSSAYQNGWGIINNSILNNNLTGGSATLGVMHVADTFTDFTITNNNISNNIIYNDGSSSYGIYIEFIGSSDVRNNIVANATAEAFHPHDVRNATVVGNIFNSTSTTLGAVVFTGSTSDNHTFINNSIKSTGFNALEIYIGRHNFKNNTIETTASGRTALFVQSTGGGETNNTYFESNNITGTAIGADIQAKGMYFNRTNLTATASNGNATQVGTNSDNTTIREGFLTRGSTGKYLSNSVGSTYFVNVTNFSTDKSAVTITGGTLHTYWYVYANVTNSTEDFITDANVSVRDTNQIFLFWNLTNGTGLTNRSEIEEFNQTSGGVTNRTPHNFSTTLSGYQNNNTDFAIVNAMVVKIYLTPAGGTTTFKSVTDALSYNEQLTSPLQGFRTQTEFLAYNEQLSKIGQMFRTTTESLTANDAVERLLTLIRSLTDSLTYSDAVTSFVTRVVSLTDTLTYTDAVERIITFVRSLTDSITYTDTITSFVTRVQSVSDIIVYNDLAQRLITLTRYLADTLTYNDALTSFVTRVTTLTDSLITSDAVVRIQSLFRSAADSIASNDAVASVLTRVISMTDTLTYNDAITSFVTRIVYMTDTLAYNDVATRFVTLVRSLTDTLTYSDALTSFVTRVVALTDNLTYNDAAVRILILLRSLTDTLTYSDALTSFVTRVTTLTDTFAFTDTAVRIQSLFRSLTDTLNYADSVFKSSLIFRTLTDTFAFTENIVLTIAKGYFMDVIDTLSYNDNVVNLVSFVRSLTDSLSSNDLAVRIITLTRYLTDTITYSDALTSFVTRVTSISDSLAISDALTSFVTRVTTLTDSITYSDVAVRLQSLFRIATDNISYAETAFKSSLIFRVLSDFFSFVESIVTITAKVSFVEVSDTLTYNDALTTLISRVTTLSESLTFNEVLARLGSFQRSLTDTLTYNDAVERLASMFRSLTDSLTYSDALTSFTTRFRSLTDSLTFSDALTSFVTRVRFVSDVLTFNDVAARLQSLFRIFSETLTFNDVIERIKTSATPPQFVIVADFFSFLDSLISSLIEGEAAPGPTPSPSGPSYGFPIQPITLDTDVRIETGSDQVIPGQRVYATITILKAGGFGVANVNLTYFLRDPTGKTVDFKTSTVGVDNIRTDIYFLTLPPDAALGVYTFRAIATYDSSQDTSVATFQVVRSLPPPVLNIKSISIPLMFTDQKADVFMTLENTGDTPLNINATFFFPEGFEPKQATELKIIESGSEELFMFETTPRVVGIYNGFVSIKFDGRGYTREFIIFSLASYLLLIPAVGAVLFLIIWKRRKKRGSYIREERISHIRRMVGE